MVIRLRQEADLWTLLMPPLVWALHFLFCYVAAAVACARLGGIILTEPSGGQSFVPLPGLGWAIAALTLLAVLLISVSAWQAWRHWGFGTGEPPHDQSTDRDRQHFLAFATLLLSALSMVGVFFVALPAFIIQDCR